MTWYGKALFFVAHCILHVFAYLLTRLVRFLWGLICCCRCLETDESRRKNNYIFRPERDLKVIHHYDRLEVLENVFGLFDVKQSRREDKQYCVEEYYLEEFENRRAMARRPVVGLTDGEPAASAPVPAPRPGNDHQRSSSALGEAPTADEQQHHQQLRSSLAGVGISDEDLPEYKQMKRDIEEEKKRLQKLKSEKMLTYTSPLYTGHIGTVMGSFRPSEEVVYSRERLLAWDGCPLYLDWLYVDGEEPEAFLTATAAADIARRRTQAASTAAHPSDDVNNNAAVNTNDVVEVEMRNGAADEAHEGSYRLHNQKRQHQQNAAAADSTPHRRAGQRRRVRRRRSAEGHGVDGLSAEPAADEEEEPHEPYQGDRRVAQAAGGQPSSPREPSQTTFSPQEDAVEATPQAAKGHKHGLLNLGGGQPTGTSSGGRWRGGLLDQIFGTPSPSAASSDARGDAGPAGIAKRAGSATVNNGRKARGVVYILPGLASYSQSNYIQRLVRALHKENYHVCVHNTRGMGPDMELGERSNFLFNGGYTRDARDVVHNVLSRENVLRRFFPELFTVSPTDDLSRVNYAVGLPVLAIGLSIGGAVLSKYLGEEGLSGRDCCIDAAITICPPNDFAKMVEHMNRGTYQKSIYQRDMCGDIKRYILRHKQLQQMPNVDNDWVFSSVNGDLRDFSKTVKESSKAKQLPEEQRGSFLKEFARKVKATPPETLLNIDHFSRVIHFDEHVIAKNAGYRSIHHYHYDTSAIKWLHYTPVPLLVLSTFDDPVIGRTVLGHRWREAINGNNYLTEHTRAKRMFNALHEPIGTPATIASSHSGSHPNLPSASQPPPSHRVPAYHHFGSERPFPPSASTEALTNNYYDRVSPTTSNADNNISRLTHTKARDILQNTIQNNKNVVYCESHCGGHMGFLSGPIDELLEREDFMQRFVLQRFEAATNFFFTHVLKIQEDSNKGNNQRASAERDNNGIQKCSAAVRKTFVEERHLDGIMRPPYAMNELKMLHQRQREQHERLEEQKKLVRHHARRTPEREPSDSEDDGRDILSHTKPGGKAVELSPRRPSPLSIATSSHSLSPASSASEESEPSAFSDPSPSKRARRGTREGGPLDSTPDKAAHKDSSRGLPERHSPTRPKHHGGRHNDHSNDRGDGEGRSAEAATVSNGGPNPFGFTASGCSAVKDGTNASDDVGTQADRGREGNLSVPPIFSKEPVPPPTWRKSNKCYFTYKTLHNTKKGSDFRTFYNTFFVDSDNDDITGDLSGNDGGACEDQEPAVAYSATNKRVNIEGPVGERLRAQRQLQQQQQQGASSGEGSSHNATSSAALEGDEAPFEVCVPIEDLYEHPNMEAIQRQNVAVGNTTADMNTDVFDLLTFSRMAVPPGRHYTLTNEFTKTNTLNRKLFDVRVSEDEAKRYFNFRGYLLNWMDNTGPYQPVRVNCDYTIDPRMYMREDL